MGVRPGLDCCTQIGCSSGLSAILPMHRLRGRRNLLLPRANRLVWTVAFMAMLASVPAIARLRGPASQTALYPAWQWLALTFPAPALVEAGAALLMGEWQGHARYLAAALTLAPVVAVFGARRPHERAWHFVVLTFLVVLALPALQVAVLRGETAPFLHTANRALLAVVVAAGWVNYLFTRHWLAATLWLAAQLCWLLPWVTQMSAVQPAALAALGQGLFAVAINLAAYRPGRQVLTPHDALWFEFRDAFGLVWAMRLLERFNTIARGSHWPWRLTWGGFCTSNKPSSEARLPPPAQTMLAGVLRRFVSCGAVATRLGGA